MKNYAAYGKTDYVKGRADTFPYENRGMKCTGQSLGKKLLPLIGLAEPISVTPAEITELEIRQMHEGFSYVMQDRSWSRFEFQSRDGGVEDLGRFRQYEVNINSAYGVAVTTHVVYTGNVRNPMTPFTEGANAYRMIPILMEEKDRDQIIVGMQEKFNEGVPPTKQNLLPLVLTPLMFGTGNIEERIKAMLILLKKSEKNVNGKLSIENTKKLEPTVYTFTNKFLNPTELENVEEVLKMSLSGQMMSEDGMETGMVKIVTTMLKKNKTTEEIHKDTDIPTKQIAKIRKSLES